MNKYSEERKKGIKNGDVPDWFITPGYQLFKEKYLHQKTIKDQYALIAATAAKHIPMFYGAEDKFFNLLWQGWLSPSTPILANMGTDRGLPVSCSGSYIADSIDGFYSTRRETALLTKYGFGTSGYFGDIRGRGSDISIGGKASGVVPVFKGFVRDMQEVAQGVARRGAFAGYLPITHSDFHELADLLLHSPDGLNVGWIINDEFIKNLDNKHEESVKRYQKALKIKMITGKGYFFFVDKANRHRPIEYIENNLDIKATNLCTEIMLPSNERYTYTCILSSMNVAKFDEWGKTDAVFWATIFLDCVASEFIEKAKNISGLEKAVKFTEDSRALGLGQCGLHTYFQRWDIPFESLNALWNSNEIALVIGRDAGTASTFLGDLLGCPKLSKTRRNSHLTAIAPTKSTSLIMGGVSEGINPDPAMLYSQNTAGGEVERITPVFLNKMKEKGKYSKKYIREIEDSFGSVQNVDWLSEEEKKTFKTAFELDMKAVTRMAAGRQAYVDQGQSLNFFFSGNDKEEYISEVHQEAFKNENILSLYYCYSNTEISASKEHCEACQ